MKARLSYFIIILFFVATACNDENEDPIDPGYAYPVASFTYSGNEGPAPVDVQFYNHSETILTDSCRYEWTFGENGPQSSLKEPMHTFENATISPKSFMVTLRVYDLVSGLSQAKSQVLVVDPQE